MSEQEHTQENCPLREAVKSPPPYWPPSTGPVRMMCGVCYLEFVGTIKLTHPPVDGTFYIDGDPECP